MKRAKTLVGLVLLACFICFMTISCQKSSTKDASVSQPTTVAQATNISQQTSPLTVDVFLASEKGALVASTLIEGQKEAILVDSQLLNSEGKRLADRIVASGKTLKAIWVTHAHPDHYFGVNQVLEKFPNTPVYSTSEIVEDIRKRNPGFVQNLKQKFGDDVTSNPFVPQVLNQNYLELEGTRIEIIKMPHGDTKNTTIVNIPSLKTVIAADVVYSGVHPFLVESNAEARSQWIESIEKIKALNPEQVIPGHKNPSLDNSPAALDKIKNYLETFGKIVKQERTPEAALAAIEKAYPDYKLSGFFLKLSVDAAYKNA